MQNNELESIGAAMQDAIHRAYALGRTDALRRVVEMVQKDELGSKAVALLGPADIKPSEPAQPEPNVEEPLANTANQSSPLNQGSATQEPDHGERVHAYDAEPHAVAEPEAPAASEPRLPWWRRPM